MGGDAESGGVVVRRLIVLLAVVCSICLFLVSNQADTRKDEFTHTMSDYSIP